MSQPVTHLYRSDGLEIDTLRGCLRRGGKEYFLRPKTLQVLLYLIEHRDRLVTREELIDQLWQGAAVTDDALVQSIVEIRRALGDDARHPHFVKTFPKTGYHFIGLVEEVTPEPAAVAEITSVAVAVEARFSQIAPPVEPILPVPRVAAPVRWSRLKLALVAGLALALIVAAMVSFAGHGFQSDAPATKVMLPHTPGKKAVAVMYFENRSGSTELDWLREGLADMLIANFSRSPRLSVLSRQQLAILLDRSGYRRAATVQLEEALEIARRTQADIIALGSFAQLGEKVRLDVQLHDARTGELLTTESLLADKAEALLTQVDLLSLKLAGHLGAAPLEPDAQRGLAAQMTSNLDAYRYYSLALEQAESFQFVEAVALLEKALALDPQFAMAHARIGYVYAVRGLEFEKGKPYLARAFALAERLSEKDKLFVTAWAATAARDSARSIEVYREIIARYPLEAEAYERLGRTLRLTGKLEEGVQVIQQGLLTDPERKELYNALGYLYLHLGRREEARAAFQRYAQLAPNDPNVYDSLGSFHQWFGEYEQALAAYQRALALNPELLVTISHLGNLYAWQGRYAAALAQYQRLVQVARNDAQRARGYNLQAWIWLRKDALAAAAAASAREQQYAGAPTWTPVAIELQRGNNPAAVRLAEPHFAPEKSAQYQEQGLLRLHYYQRGYLALKTGRASEAVENFRTALRHPALEWHIDSYEDCLAKAYLNTSRVDEAIAEYERILKINPNFPLAHYHLAQAYERKGDSAQARTNYERLLHVWKLADADLPEIIDAKARLGL